MEKTRVDVSIIIVSYNTRELLRDCLKSVWKRTDSLEYEVIVVDNASVDGSQEMVMEDFNQVRLVALPENIGFGRANNEGIKLAKGRNIFFLNPDTVLLNNAVKILCDFLDGHEKVGVCGGNLYAENMTPAHSYMMYLPSLAGEFNEMLFGLWFRWRYGKNLEFNHGRTPLEVGYVTGADMMVKKKVLDEVGCFDSVFFMYFEETELSWRIRRAGYKIMSVPTAKIVHLEGQSISLKEHREQMYLSSRRLYFKKVYSSGVKRSLCHFFYGMKALLQIVYYSCYHRDKRQKEIWKYRYRHF